MTRLAHGPLGPHSCDSRKELRKHSRRSACACACRHGCPSRRGRCRHASTHAQSRHCVEGSPFPTSMGSARMPACVPAALYVRIGRACGENVESVSASPFSFRRAVRRCRAGSARYAKSSAIRTRGGCRSAPAEPMRGHHEGTAQLPREGTFKMRTACRLRPLLKRLAETGALASTHVRNASASGTSPARTRGTTVPPHCVRAQPGETPGGRRSTPRARREREIP